MLRIILALPLLAGLMAQPVAADALQGVTARDRTAIHDVVQRQLEAFQRDDGVAAFAFASPGIQAMFGTPENFLGMVRSGYAPVYRPREVEFQNLVDDGGRLTQRVLLVGPDGEVVVAHYYMERQGDGSWRISGCELMGSEQQSS
jgi:hypothetical protein